MFIGPAIDKHRGKEYTREMTSVAEQIMRLTCHCVSKVQSNTKG